MKRLRYCAGINTQRTSGDDFDFVFSLQSVIYLHNLIRPLITSFAQKLI